MIAIQEKTADKREEILDIAESLFAEQGFEAVSVREISKAAGINIAMVSYYFGSKEKLYEEVILRKLILPEHLRSSIQSCETQFEKLFVLVDIYIDRFFHRRNFQNIIFREMAMNQRTYMADLITEQIHQNFQLYAEIIRKGIRQKEFRKVDVEMTVMSIIGIIRMYVTSGNMACRILQTADESETYGLKYQQRLRKHIRELLQHHLTPLTSSI